jgi:hypothetical protein
MGLKSPRWNLFLVVSLALCAGAVSIAPLEALAQSPAAKSKPAAHAKKKAVAEKSDSAKPAPAPSLLPDAFDGWVETAPAQKLADAAQADPTSASALKEYDFTSGSSAIYRRSGDTLTLHALQFRDASGAYGAYTFYRQNGWPKEDIGEGATSNHNRVLFWQGNTVVDATFSEIGPMSAAELRELAGGLPKAEGTQALAPPILADLPQQSLDGQTTHYAVGPADYAGSGGVLPADLVGFDRGAEAVTASYTLRSGPATLTLIDYPTPQMAIAQEPKIRAYIKAGASAQPAWPKPLQDSDPASLDVRRSGPLVAIVSGDAIPDESHKLLESVHFDSQLTSIPQPGGESEISKTSKLLLGIAAMVIVGGSAALLLGFFLGGGRALYRVARGRPVSSVYDAEFIHLDLREDDPVATPAVDRAHPKG